MTAEETETECEKERKFSGRRYGYKVVTNYSQIKKERENPWRSRLESVRVEVEKDQLERVERVVTKQGKINTRRHTVRKQLSLTIKDLFISSIQLSWSWTFFNPSRPTFCPGWSSLCSGI